MRNLKQIVEETLNIKPTIDIFMIKLNVNPDISKARSIDSEFYINSKYYNVSLDKIFKKSWQLTCHKSELVKTNLYPFTFLDNSISEPLIIYSRLRGA